MKITKVQVESITWTGDYEYLPVVVLRVSLSIGSTRKETWTLTQDEQAQARALFEKISKRLQED